MDQRRLPGVGVLAGALLACVPLAGCGPPDPAATLAKLNQTNVQRLANLYFAYQKKNGFRGPKDEADFRAFVTGYSPKKLERIGVDPASVDGLFVGERDGQPLKIRYRVAGSAMGSREPVVFEAEGQGGRRVVGFLDMTQREVEADEYDRLWAGQGVEANQRG